MFWLKIRLIIEKLICHYNYVERCILRSENWDFQICFDLKLENAKFDIHNCIGVNSANCLICHKQYGERIFVRSKK